MSAVPADDHLWFFGVARGRPNRRAEPVVGKIQHQTKVSLQQGFCQLHGRCRVAEIELAVVMNPAGRERSVCPEHDSGVGKGERNNKDPRNKNSHSRKARVLLCKPPEVRFRVVKAPKVAVGRQSRRRAMGPTGARCAGPGSAEG